MTDNSTNRSGETIVVLWLLTVGLWAVAVVSNRYALTGGLAMLILALQALSIALGWVEVRV